MFGKPDKTDLLDWKISELFKNKTHGNIFNQKSNKQDVSKHSTNAQEGASVPIIAKSIS